MFPFRLSTVFTSRWMALLWAAGIIWFAYDFAGSQLQVDNSVDANQTAAAANAL